MPRRPKTWWSPATLENVATGACDVIYDVLTPAWSPTAGAITASTMSRQTSLIIVIVIISSAPQSHNRGSCCPQQATKSGPAVRGFYTAFSDTVAGRATESAS